MKAIKFYAIAALAATTLLASCSKDDNDPNISGNKASLSIGVKSPEMTRATGAVPADAVANFKAFVVDGDNSLKTGYSATGANLDGSNAIEVTTQAKRVYVIANAGNIDMADETAIKDYIADLNGTGSQTSTRWATGSEALQSSDFIQNGSDWVATKPVQLTFVAARITLEIAIGGDMVGNYNASATDGSLVLDKVVVLNARGQSLLFGASSLIPTAYDANKKYYEGIANPTPGFNFYPSATDFTVATGLLSDAITAGDFTSKYYYYVFENDAATAAEFPTVVTIAGTYDNKEIYFPVHLAPYEEWGTGSDSPDFIKRGNSYNIKITLTGDPRFSTGGSHPGDTGGTDDPTNPVVTAKVEVIIDLTDWIPYTLNKEF